MCGSGVALCDTAKFRIAASLQQVAAGKDAICMVFSLKKLIKVGRNDTFR